MATYESLKIITLPAGEDLSARGNHAVTLNASGRIVSTDAVTEVIVGTVAEKPSAAVGSPVSVALIAGGGIINMVAQAAVTRGHIVIPTTTDGKVAGVANIAALVANQMGAGIALEAAVADQVFEVLAMPIAGPTG